jgi:hypothetical protein
MHKEGLLKDKIEELEKHVEKFNAFEYTFPVESHTRHL